LGHFLKALKNSLVREDKKRIIILFVGSRENFYKELQRYLEG